MVRINVRDVKEGSILAEEVLSSSQRTIIPKKTVLSQEHIEVLRAFLIQEITIEKVMVDGSPIDFKPVALGAYIENKKEKGKLEELFLQTTSEYKRQFKSWQAGVPVDVSKIRTIILPLIEKIEENDQDLFQLHHYSTVDDYFYQHSVAVSLISYYLARKTGYEKGEAFQVALAGCLCDCGMAKIPEHILLKKKALTEDEFAEVKKHPIFSYRLIQQTPLLKEATKVAIIQHHERLDGSGYPMSEAMKIHPYAKLIAVADIYHAMTSERLYRHKQSPYRVIEMLIKDLFGQYETSAIQALQTGLMNFRVGSKVRLSNGQLAEVLFIEKTNLTRPLVKIIDTEEMIHLNRNLHLFIDDILS